MPRRNHVLMPGGLSRVTFSTLSCRTFLSRKARFLREQLSIKEGAFTLHLEVFHRYAIFFCRVCPTLFLEPSWKARWRKPYNQALCRGRARASQVFSTLQHYGLSTQAWPTRLGGPCAHRGPFCSPEALRLPTKKTWCNALLQRSAATTPGFGRKPNYYTTDACRCIKQPRTCNLGAIYSINFAWRTFVGCRILYEPSP